jgi:rhamnosyltransferase
MGVPLISVIVRSKNEEMWIGDCLSAIQKQSYVNKEVILVDNESTDKTVEKALEYDITLVKIKKFMPGLAINMGIRASSGDIIVCISAHCIPTSDVWLENLIAPLCNPTVAGVYGRQLPMNFTSALDKRDLAIVFGLDRRIQEKDGFFHNANSAIRRKDWDLFPFDETATNIEDRLWGNQMISQGRQLCYEPSAMVFHHHGIHQGQSEKRAESIIRIIEDSEGVESQGTISASGRNIIAIIPFNGQVSALNILLIERTIKQLRDSKYIRRIVIGVTDKNLAGHFSNHGSDIFVYPRDEIREKTQALSLAEICCDLLNIYEENSSVVDAAVIASPKNTFRHAGLISKVLDELYLGGYDSVFPAFADTRDIFSVDSKMVTQVPEKFDVPRMEKDHYAIAAVNGLGLAVRANHLRQGSFKSLNSAAHIVTSQISAIEVDDCKFDAAMFEGLVAWFEASFNA